MFPTFANTKTFLKIEEMDFTIKILAIAGKFGRVEAAKMVGVSHPTLQSKIKNPGNWKFSEIQKIEEIYNEHFPNSNGELSKQS